MSNETALPALSVKFNYHNDGLEAASNAMKKFGSESGGISKGIAGAFSKLGSTIGGELGNVISEVGDGFEKLGEKGKKLEAIGGILTGVGVGLTAMGAKEKQATDQLNQAVIDSGHSVEEYKDKFEKAVKTQENYNHSAEDTKAALQKMTQATGDPSKALANMGLVANLAAAQHVSLADAAGMVDKIMSGKGARTLAQYGITMPKATNAAVDLTKATRAHEVAVNQVASAEGKYKLLQDQLSVKKKVTIADNDRLAIAQQKIVSAQTNLNLSDQKLAQAHADAANAGKAQKDVIDQLSKKIDGQAKASVNNLGSQFDILKTKALDATAAFGQKFGPAITAAGPVMSGFGAVLGIIKARHVAAAAAAIAQGEAEVAGTVAAEGATSAFAALNFTMLANPIFLIIAGTVALTAAFVLAYKHIKWFHDGVNAIWKGIKTVAVTIFDGLVGAFKRWGKMILIGLTGPIGIMVYEVVKHWNTIKNAASTVFNAVIGIVKTAGKLIGGAIHLISAGFNAFGDGVNAVGETVGKFFSGFWKMLSGFGSKLFDIGKNTWSFFTKGIEEALSKVGGIVTGALGKIPFLKGILGHMGIKIDTQVPNMSTPKPVTASPLGGPVGGATSYTTINVQAQGLTVAQVQKEALRKQRTLAVVGG